MWLAVDVDHRVTCGFEQHDTLFGRVERGVGIAAADLLRIERAVVARFHGVPHAELAIGRLQRGAGRRFFPRAGNELRFNRIALQGQPAVLTDGGQHEVLAWSYRRRWIGRSRFRLIRQRCQRKDND